MKYKVLDSFRARTSGGERTIPRGQIVTLPKQLAMRLLNEGKIAPAEKMAFRVWSEILQAYLWIVETDQDMDAISELKGETINSFDEIKEMRKLSPEGIKQIHEVKKVFQGSKVRNVTRKDEK